MVLKASVTTEAESHCPAFWVVATGAEQPRGQLMVLGGERKSAAVPGFISTSIAGDAFPTTTVTVTICGESRALGSATVTAAV